MRSDPDLSMPLSAHLQELRGRLIKSAIAVGIGFAVTYNWADLVFAFLTRPLLDIRAENVTFIGNS